MKVLLSESLFDDLKVRVKSLCRDLFVGARRGHLQLHQLKSDDPNFFAVVLLPDGGYGFIPKSAYKGIKKVEVAYHNGTTGIENRADVDEQDVIAIENASIIQLDTLKKIITGEVFAFNSNLKYTNT